jgi:uncharacterized membrane protein
MKIASFILLGLSVLLILIYIVFSGPTYGTGKFGVMHNSMPIAASFLLFTGIALFLVDYNLRRRRRRRNDVHHDPRADRRL